VFGATRVPTGACHASRLQTLTSLSQDHANESKMIKHDLWLLI
jgi:hypothetical protein